MAKQPTRRVNRPNKISVMFGFKGSRAYARWTGVKAGDLFVVESISRKDSDNTREYPTVVLKLIPQTPQYCRDCNNRYRGKCPKHTTK